jgi:hypothetical protein
MSNGAPSLPERSPLLCAAHGCPNAWSVGAVNGHLCHEHAWAERHEWPEITQRILWGETDRARANSARPIVPLAALSREEKVAQLRALQLLFRERRDSQTKGPNRSWAYALAERESRGEPLTQAQRQMWRDALGPARAPHDEPEVPA